MNLEKKNDKPQFIPIIKIVHETTHVKTFYFDYELNSKPGQFVMLWVPDIDQKPFSVAFDDGKSFGLTVFKRGPMTEKMFEMKIGDRVGISGPYGTSFSVKPNTNYIMVAGGYGAAPLGFLADKLDATCQIDFCMGARSVEHLLFENKLLQKSNVKLHIATDDGSRGHKGFVTDLLEDLFKNRDQQKIAVTCGPELMEKKVLDLSNLYDVDCEVSMERYMKCGIGVCGQCAVDDIGICLCKSGPVLKKEIVNKIKEFGIYHRDKSGAKQYFN